MHTLDDNKIIEYSKLSIEEKLKWLGDALIFNAVVFSKKEKEIREKIKEMV